MKRCITLYLFRLTAFSRVRASGSSRIRRVVVVPLELDRRRTGGSERTQRRLLAHLSFREDADHANGNVITIVSENPGTSCFIPVPPQPYEVVADLGPLPAGQYDVTWRKGAAVIGATFDSRGLVMPAVAKIQGGGQQIAIAGASLARAFIVRVFDTHGYPVAGVPVVIAPAVGAESGVRRDEFGFRGFNTAADLTTWGPLLPRYLVTTDKDGFATGQGPLFEPASSASLWGAKVQLPPPQNVETFFSVVTVAAPPAVDSAAVVVEYFNRDLGHYFMTPGENEISALDAGKAPGWLRSVGGFVAYPVERPRAPASVPVCRFFSSQVNSHFFTADPAECDAVIAKWPDIWTLETRAAFWIEVPSGSTGQCSPTTQPVYRLYNNRSDANHRYVTDLALRDTMVSRGWVSEGLGPQGVVMCTLR